MPASLDLPTLLPEVPDRFHQQQLHYYFPAVHASVDPDSSSHKMLLQKALHFAKQMFPGYQALVVTHTDGYNESGNIHTHIVINSVRKTAVEGSRIWINHMKKPPVTSIVPLINS